MFRRLGPILLCLLWASCTAGVPEFLQFAAAYEVQAVEADKVLDRLAEAERVLVRRRFARDAGVRAFVPAEAAYYLDVGDPPLTGAIRASMRSVGLYNDTLAGLATGEAASALTVRIGDASAALAVAAGSLALLAGAGIAAPPAIGIAIERLRPLLGRLAGAASRAEFRRRLVAAYPDIRALVLAVRGGTAQMFVVIKRSYVQPGLLGGTDGIAKADLAALAADRRLLAGWVVLLDRTLVAMDRAKAAVERGSPADVAALVSASIGIRALAGTIRALRSAEPATAQGRAW